MTDAFADPWPVDPAAAARVAALDRADGAPIDLPPLVPEDRPPLVAPLPLLGVDELVRVATDAEPDAGELAPDLALGWFADHADRETLRAAIAWGASMPLGDVAPLARAARDKRFPRAVRDTLHAVRWAPIAVWEVERWGDEVVVLRDLIGLGAQAPTGPVRLRPPATPFGPGSLLLTAVAWGPDGPETVAPIAVPRVPDPLRGLSAAVRRARALEPSLRTLADALRLQGHAVARAVVARAAAGAP